MSQPTFQRREVEPLASPRGVGPNWRQVGAFVGLTFAITYLLDLGLYLTVGYSSHPATVMLLQLQMLLPAAVAIFLQLVLFRNSPLFRLKGPARWFFYFYLAYTLVYVALAVSVALMPGAVWATAASLVTLGLSVAGLLVAILLRLVAGGESFRRVGLAGGKVKHYLLFGLLVVFVYGAMTALNALLGLGQAVDLQALLAGAGGAQAEALGELPGNALLILLGVQTVILGPFLGLLIAFGEEYGWRGYLQSELVKMGKVRGLLVLGVIWGLWHAPIIAMGHNYPGYPLQGIVIMTLYTMGLAFFLGYAVLKTGSTWLAAFLHVLNNQAASFFIAMVYTPADPIFSFGAGLGGVVVWAIVVAGLFLFDRKTWRSPLTAAQVAIPIDMENGPGGEA
jgi:uncharacterized protein